MATFAVVAKLTVGASPRAGVLSLTGPSLMLSMIVHVAAAAVTDMTSNGHAPAATVVLAAAEPDNVDSTELAGRRGSTGKAGTVITSQ